MLSRLVRLLAPLGRETSPFSIPAPSRYTRGARWVEPRLVGEVAFTGRISDGACGIPAGAACAPIPTPGRCTSTPSEAPTEPGAAPRPRCRHCSAQGIMGQLDPVHLHASPGDCSQGGRTKPASVHVLSASARCERAFFARSCSATSEMNRVQVVSGCGAQLSMVI
jgi:hypothetical protein